MNISISSDLVSFVDQLVTDGNFPTRDAADCDALKRLRDDQARFKELKASMDEAVVEYERGEAQSTETGGGTRPDVTSHAGGRSHFAC